MTTSLSDDERDSHSGPWREILLVGKHGGMMTRVDADVYDFLSQWSWFRLPVALNQGYVFRIERSKGEQRTLYMARIVMGDPPGLEVDHIRVSETLDNRRGNLRVVDRSTNGRNRRIQRNNTSGLRGVTWRKNDSKWQAQIRVHGKNIYCGSFSTAEEAFQAYEAERERHGLIRAERD